MGIEHLEIETTPTILRRAGENFYEPLLQIYVTYDLDSALLELFKNYASRSTQLPIRKANW